MCARNSSLLMVPCRGGRLETRKEGPKDVRQSSVRGECLIDGLFVPDGSGLVPSTNERAVLCIVV